jgi:hypothetical protein
MPANPPTDPPPHPADIPPDVNITWQARKPENDPTVGVPVPAADAAPAHHRLVVLGDSLAQGFQSLAISKTDQSFPALIAKELGWFDQFRFPTYDGYGGLPLNLELTLRNLEAQFGEVSLIESLPATAWLLHWAHQIEHWWTTGADQTWHPGPGLMHNLAVYSYAVTDALDQTLAADEASITPPSHEWLRLSVPDDVPRAARRVMANASPSMAPIDAAKAHGEDGGIETLLVALGANNALGVVIDLDLVWSTQTPDRAKWKVWTPTQFDADWTRLVARLLEIKAQHVIVATVPHVTIAPLFSGVGDRLRPDSRYFQYYTHAWLAPDFDQRRDRYITGEQARAIDSAIDQYNLTIVESVKTQRQAGHDWYLFDMGGMLDRFAARRYLENPAAQPRWWEDVGGAYPVPDALKPPQLTPEPDTAFLQANSTGRTAGGWFALDGVHPTTIGYGMVAQAIIDIMHGQAGVKFYDGTGAERATPVIDFAALRNSDTLISDPPRTLSDDLSIVRHLNAKLDILAHLLGRPGL